MKCHNTLLGGSRIFNNFKCGIFYARKFNQSLKFSHAKLSKEQNVIPELIDSPKGESGATSAILPGRRQTRRHLRANGRSLLPLALRPRLASEQKETMQTIFSGHTQGRLAELIAPKKYLHGFGTDTVLACELIVQKRYLHGFVPTILLLLVFIFVQNACVSEVSAASMTLTVPAAITLDVQPTGTLAKSTASSFSAKTDGAWGYNLSIKAKSTTDMVNGSAKLTTISKTMPESEYTAAGNNNTWGFIPSKLNNNANTSFIAATTSATTIEKTAAANASAANSYNITLGAKADSTAVQGTYSNTLVMTLAANTVNYNITYNLNSGSWSGTSPQTGTTSGSTIKLDSAKPTRSNYEFKGWCTVSTTNESCSGTTYQPGADYKLQNNSNTLTLYAMWKQSVVYMQNWNGCSSLSEHQVVTLTDSRDNNSYTVSKLKDGKCWMTQNLRIGDSHLSNRTLTPSDTNISVNYVLPVSSVNGFLDKSSHNLYVDEKYNSGYYIWCTASAGTSCPNEQTSSSICPKGWRLPTYDESKALVNIYNKNNDGSLLKAPANFILAGRYFDSKFYEDGKIGVWWTSDGYILFLYATSGGATSEVQNRGDSVRCVSA